MTVDLLHIKFALQSLRERTLAEIDALEAIVDRALPEDAENCIPDKDTVAEECLDDIPALAKLHKLLMDPAAKGWQIETAKNDLFFEVQQNIELRKSLRTRG